MQSKNEEIVVNSLAHFYDMMLRNGYYLPNLKSGFVTFDYLNKVRLGHVFCPKYATLKLRACPKPPEKKDIIFSLLEEAVKINEVIGFDLESKVQPNKDWLLATLSTLNADHPYFHREYEAPRKVKQVKASLFINNDDEFFSGLAHIGKRYKKKNRAIGFMVRSVKMWESRRAWACGRPTPNSDIRSPTQK